MVRAGWFCLPVMVVISLFGCASQPAVPSKPKLTSDQTPHYRLRAHEAVYTGPGRNEVETAQATVIDIGWFGPADDENSTGRPMWRAAKLALDHANSQRPEGGPTFRLVARWSENPWGTGIGELARLVYDGEIVAIAGAPDGTSAHLVEQLAAKARITFVSTASTDKTVNLANVPWVFSCVPGDHAWAPVLAEAMNERIASARWVMVSFTDHDSRQASDELLKACARHQLHPVWRFTLPPGMTDFSEALEVLKAEPVSLAVVGGAADTACALKALGQHAGEVFCGPSVARGAADSFDGVVAPILWDPTHPHAAAFVEAYRQRYGTMPDYTAAYTYDGVRLLIDCIRRAGTNRVLVRDAVRAVDYDGVTGHISWDPVGQNPAEARLGVMRGGVLVPIARSR